MISLMKKFLKILDFALHRLNNVIENLIVFEENIKENLEKLRGLVFSQRVLLKLIENGRYYLER